MAIGLEIAIKPKQSKVLEALNHHLADEMRKQFGFMGKRFLAIFRKGVRGEYLQQRSGKLGRSMKYEVGGTTIDNLFVQWSANTPYARLQHEGFPNRPVTAKQHANSIFFIEGVGWRRFKKSTKTVTFFPHPYFTDKLRRLRDRVRIYIRTAIRMASQKGRLAA